MRRKTLMGPLSAFPLSNYLKLCGCVQFWLTVRLCFMSARPAVPSPLCLSLHCAANIFHCSLKPLI